MTSLLERRYRSALRLLPAYYRERREDEMVEAFLDGAEERSGARDAASAEAAREEMRPAAGELASIAVLAVRTRLGAAKGPGTPARYAAAGAAVRMFGLLGLLLHAANAVTERALALAWLQGASVGDRETYLGVFTGHGLPSSLREVAQWLLPLCWVGAYAALTRGHRRAALSFAVCAAVPALLSVVDLADLGMAPDALTFAHIALGWLTVLALCSGFHEDAPAPRLPLLPPGQALLAMCVLMGASVAALPPVADEVWALATAVLALTVLWYGARVRGAEATADPGTPLALAALGALVLAVRTSGLLLYPTGGLPHTMLLFLSVQTAVLALGTVALAVSGLRRLPARKRYGAEESATG
ncbi:hypothetical protein [Streptomyces sp. ODS28]|uniref:hypothetical protein n=1 Tax=Streptomyces sp. ODS28 TaxID=3136688 RepID=UPI0031EF0413